MTTENLFAKENQLLKAEIELLKREIDLMKREANLNQNTSSPTIDIITEIIKKMTEATREVIGKNIITKKETEDKSETRGLVNNKGYSEYIPCNKCVTSPSECNSSAKNDIWAFHRNKNGELNLSIRQKELVIPPPENPYTDGKALPVFVHPDLNSVIFQRVDSSGNEIGEPIVGNPNLPMNCIEKKSCETKDKSDNDQIFKKANHLCYSNYNECYSGKQHNPQDLNYRRCSDGSKVLTRFPTVDVPNTTTDTKPEDTTNGGQDIKPNEGKTCCKEYSNDTIDKLRYLERGLYDIIYNKPMDDRLPFVINEYGSLVSKPDTCKNTCV